MQYFYLDKSGKRKRYHYCSDCRIRFTEDQLKSQEGVQNYGTIRNPIILCDACSIIKLGPKKAKSALDEEPDEDRVDDPMEGSPD